MKPGYCFCGLRLHYSTFELQELVEALIKETGEYLEIHAGGRTWRVQKHYIALHGIKATDLPYLGFEEVQRDSGCVHREVGNSPRPAE